MGIPSVNLPIQDSTDEGGDEGDTGVGAGHGLSHREEESQIAVNTELGLQSFGGLNKLLEFTNLITKPR